MSLAVFDPDTLIALCTIQLSREIMCIVECAVLARVSVEFEVASVTDKGLCLLDRFKSVNA